MELIQKQTILVTEFCQIDKLKLTVTERAILRCNLILHTCEKPVGLMACPCIQNKGM